LGDRIHLKKDIDCFSPDSKNELEDGFLNKILLTFNGVVKTADRLQEKQQIQSSEPIF